MLAALALVAVVLPLMPARATTPAGCHAGTPDEAARALIHPGARVDGFDRIAGFHTARVIAPLIVPGTPFLLVRGDGVWCDAHGGFNAIRPHDPRTAAMAFARLAGTPWFADARVRSVAARGDAFALVTHSPDNGVVAEWAISIDARGISEATWTAVAFGRPPFTPRLEGLTALPGATHTWVRNGATLKGTSSILPTPEIEHLQAQAVTSDGFVLQVRQGDTPVGITFTDETGIEPLDTIGTVRRFALDNYETFLDWGLVGNRWAEPTGTIAVDDALSLVCLACVQVSLSFNVHIFSRVVEVAELVLGLEFADRTTALSLILGHEIFHNFQLSAIQYDPSVGMPEGSFMEGTARFQETLHPYSATAHVPGSDIYADDINGCNGYLAHGREVQAGPAIGHLYDACLFWMAWYARHGIDGVAALLDAMAAHYGTIGWSELRPTIRDATGRGVTGDLVHFAATVLTLRGLRWGPATGGGPRLNWGKYLRPWTPPTLRRGETVDAFLSQGAMLGVALPRAGRIVVRVTEGPPVTVVEIREGARLSTRRITSGARIDAPGKGERVWVVVIQARDDASDVRLRLR